MRTAPHRLLLAAAAATVLAGTGAAMAAPSSNGASWHVGYYNPSNQALSQAQADNSSTGVAQLNFTSEDNTALLTTDQGSQKSLLGDISGKTAEAKYNIDGATGAFTYYGEPDGCNSPASARLFFTTSNAGGFDETHYWWSNPTSAALANGPADLSVALDGANWTDFYGHRGDDPAYAAGFQAAVSNVKTIGLSFGGGCFFENGVGTTDGTGTLTLNSFSVS